MRRLHSRSGRLALLALCVIPVFFACSLGGGSSSSSSSGGSSSTTSGGGSTTTTPPPCATHATANAEGWIQNHQIFGTISGGAATQLTNFTYPVGLPQDSGATFEGPIQGAWAPDGQHFAVIMEVVPNLGIGPPPAFFYPYIVDATTHTAALVAIPGSAVQNENFELAWADNHTLILFPRVAYQESGAGTSLVPSGSVTVTSYDITTHALTTLPGITNAFDGEVRCATLYYLSVPTLNRIGANSFGVSLFRGTASLYRYDLASHTVTGSGVVLGNTAASEGSELGPYPSAPGWDVSQDSTHLVYQHMTVSAASGAHPDGNTTSQFFVANTDGTGATGILPSGGANSSASVAISPNGALVAVTDANPTPNIMTGPLAGGALRAYAPDATGTPAWLADSSGFDALGFTDAGELGVERYLLSTPPGPLSRVPGTTVVPGGSTPFSLPN
jgi:hypothetical protein